MGTFRNKYKYMNFKEFQQESARTCASLGSKELDLFHMVAGMISEVSEVIEVVETDQGNMGEEIADILWYMSNYTRMRGHDFEAMESSISDNVFEVNFATLVINIANVCDNVKKLVAYGKEIDFEREENQLKEALQVIGYLARRYGIDYQQELQLNIDKLRKRFPEKFDAVQAIERNTTEEQKLWQQ